MAGKMKRLKAGEMRGTGRRNIRGRERAPRTSVVIIFNQWFSRSAFPLACHLGRNYRPVLNPRYAPYFVLSS